MRQHEMREYCTSNLCYHVCRNSQENELDVDEGRTGQAGEVEKQEKFPRACSGKVIYSGGKNRSQPKGK